MTYRTCTFVMLSGHYTRISKTDLEAVGVCEVCGCAEDEYTLVQCRTHHDAVCLRTCYRTVSLASNHLLLFPRC